MNSGEFSRVFVHPHGLCESENVGAGTRVWAFAHVLAGAKVGSDCNICDHAYVESGVTIGDRVTVKNRVLLFEGVTIEDDVFLGPAVVFTNDLRPRAPIKRSGDELAPDARHARRHVGCRCHRSVRIDYRSTRVYRGGGGRHPRCSRL